MILTIRSILLCFMLWLAPFQSAQSATSIDLAELTAELTPDEPLEVAVGVIITQITDVDQRAEKFDVVARIRMLWQDPDLAFDPEVEGRKVFNLAGKDFLDKGREAGIRVPAFTIENQLARSFTKHSAVSWIADGTAQYTEEVILSLQAPDFEFTRYPFDLQKFYLRILATAPEGFIRYVELEDASGMGDTLGEEEWRVREVWTEIDTATGISGLTAARFSLGFEADRHLLYYSARVFVPLLLLISVSWANLFLEEYRRRIDIAGANLLVFVAFSFTIAGDLPRLGYLTFLDVLLMIFFILAAATVAYNVALRRMSVHGREEAARQIDRHVTYWGFPLLYIVAVLVIAMIFLR